MIPMNYRGWEIKIRRYHDEEEIQYTVYINYPGELVISRPGYGSVGEACSCALAIIDELHPHVQQRIVSANCLTSTLT